MLIENMTPLPKMARIVIDDEFVGLPMLLDEAAFWIYRNTRRFPDSVIGWVTAKGEVITPEPEYFQLVANETVKVGTPVSRNDADYWINQFARLGAIGEGERVGRVKAR